MAGSWSDGASHCNEDNPPETAIEDARAGQSPGLAFLAAVFFADAFLADVFFATFLVVVFLAAARFRGVAGPLARRSTRSSAARSMVISSTESPFRRLALDSPSVTYGPNRPSRTTTG